MYFLVVGLICVNIIIEFIFDGALFFFNDKQEAVGNNMTILCTFIIHQCDIIFTVYTISVKKETKLNWRNSLKWYIFCINKHYI